MTSVSAAADEIVVTNTNDDGPGSLRDALDQANDTSAKDIIVFADGVAGTIALETSLSIDETVDIIGPGSDVVTLDGDDGLRLINSQVDVLIDGLTLARGSASSGAAMHARFGDVHIRNSVVTNNVAGPLGGGGIVVVDGDLTIEDSTFFMNSTDGLGGAVISTGGEVTVRDSTFDTNLSRAGGALFVSGATDVTSSTFVDNEALALGGAISSDEADLQLIDVSFQRNEAGSDGGAIYVVDGEFVVYGGDFTRNEALGNGGAIRIVNDDASLTGVTLDSNEAVDGGAIYHDGPGRELDIQVSTLVGNTASDDGGAVVAEDELSVILSTVTANEADESGGAFFAGESDSEDVRFLFSTIVGNSAGLGGGIYSTDFVQLEYSIVADNMAPDGPDLFGDVEADWSLIGDAEGADVAGANNLSGDPRLNPLADNGSLTADLGIGSLTFRTQTMLPRLDSPVIDIESPAFFMEIFDQRGELRPAGAGIDIGAVEVVASDRPTWTPITPARLVDTRPTGETVDGLFERGGKRSSGATLQLQIAGRGGVPDGASAAIINVTAVAPEATGFVTIWDCDGAPPLASSLNHTEGVNLGNEVIAQLGDDGEICVFTDQRTHLTVDAVGHLSEFGPYVATSPMRLVDTRPGQDTIDGSYAGGGRRNAGTELRLDVAGRGDIAEDASAVTINITAIGAPATGFVTVHACEASRPLASSLNYTEGVNRGNEVTAELDDDGFVCIYTDQSIHLNVDAVGFLIEGSDLTPVAPARLFDSRSQGSTIDGSFEGAGVLGAGTVTELVVGGRADLPVSAATATLNITAVNPLERGFVTVYRCDTQRPLASSLNYEPGTNGGNDIVVGLAVHDGGDPANICIYNDTQTHLTVDVTAYTTIGAPPTV